MLLFCLGLRYSLRQVGLNAPWNICMPSLLLTHADMHRSSPPTIPSPSLSPARTDTLPQKHTPSAYKHTCPLPNSRASGCPHFPIPSGPSRQVPRGSPSAGLTAKACGKLHEVRIIPIHVYSSVHVPLARVFRRSRPPGLPSAAGLPSTWANRSGHRFLAARAAPAGPALRD